ncbi:uncharacterized protein LOC133800940 [Humulus lupulus]|uniref:uncharacterized protein LOC133800940 n=1 Tax=Humulus lupulus TaxID=3486 RepID=UPI002B401ACC|nr:uncharacterized protein LOC133800940 [Humulus lupulus]
MEFEGDHQTHRAKRLSYENEEIKSNKFWEVPEEVVEKILLSLDAKSLRSCMEVCRGWFHLINNPSFANKHLLGQHLFPVSDGFGCSWVEVSCRTWRTLNAVKRKKRYVCSTPHCPAVKEITVAYKKIHNH